MIRDVILFGAIASLAVSYSGCCCGVDRCRSYDSRQFGYRYNRCSGSQVGCHSCGAGTSVGGQAFSPEPIPQPRPAPIVNPPADDTGNPFLDDPDQASRIKGRINLVDWQTFSHIPANQALRSIRRIRNQ